MLPQHLNPIALNNMAVHQLEDGDFKAAEQILAGALACLVKMSRRSESPNKKRSRAVHFSWSKEAPTPNNSDTDDDLIGTFIYSRGMFLNQTKHGTPEVTGEVKAVIAYNAALATHLLAIETSESALLRKALAFYNLSHKALRKLCSGGAKPALCFKLHFHMVILNNQGQLTYQLVDYRSSQLCFKQLAKNVRFLMGRKNSSSRAYCPTDMRGMLGNSLIETPTTAPCA